MSSQSLPLVLDKAARRFGRRWALRGVTLRVHPREVVAVTGVNGSGKSTLLRVAATALGLTAGEGTVFGHNLRRDAAAVRPLVALLGQAAGVYQDLTVEENLRFAARMLALPDDRVDEALDRAGLRAQRHERVRNLSSGWQRRVALARLWLQEPKLLLLDEPYNSFDAAGVDIVNDLIASTRDRGGGTLLVTHNLPYASTRVDRHLTLHAGVHG